MEELGFYNGSLAGNGFDTDGTVGETGEIIGEILPASQDGAVLVCWGEAQRRGEEGQKGQGWGRTRLTL